MIVLGKKYKDIITGLSGIATGRAEYLTGCTQVLLTPRLVRDGESNARWLDEPRLQPVGNAKAIKLPGAQKDPGGPQDHPHRDTAPIR